jgi:magnesium transporter
MSDTHFAEPWERLAELLPRGDAQQIERFLDELPSGDVPLVVSRLSDDQQSELLTALAPEQAAELLHQLVYVQAVNAIEHLEPEAAAAILDELPSDEQADLIGELDREDAEAILSQMEPSDATEARALIAYEDDVAGGLMVTEYLSYGETLTVGDVIADMRDRAEEYRDFDVQYAYVCDQSERLTGVLRLRDLLLASRHVAIRDLQIRDPLSVIVDTPLEELADFFDRYSFLGVPVTDSAGRLVGVVHQAAVADAWNEQQDSTFLKTQGIVGGEELRSMPLLRRSSRRLAWLSVNIVLNVIAASIIALYQETLSTVIALAVFLPIISDMSGCSGNQAVAVSLRELSFGLVRPNELLRVWFKEASLGVINGSVLGVMVAIVAWLWKGNVYLGLVVGTALCLNTVVAVSIGGIIPLVLKRFKMDPAIAAGPILTTITDMCGFFLVLGIATAFLNRLSGM